jgi:hypothetical protein
MDLSKLTTLGSCYPPCPERLHALVNEEFGPAKTLGGWVFRDGPTRVLNEGAKWREAYFGRELEDHTHEPYVWAHSCPWCGRDLPPPPDDEGLGDPNE